ncbi:MAG: hypothetical protein HOA17_08245 [Candidatus Melainabacteria bacterium]|nr:hypothetical protein [Candidatus Melainabacteria bacterium]
MVKEEQADGFTNRNYESLFKACDDIFTIKIKAAKLGKTKGSDNLGDVVRFLEFLIQRFDKANPVIVARPIRGLGKYAQIMPFGELKEAGLRLITMYKARLGNDDALNTIASDLAKEDIDGTRDRVLAGFTRGTGISDAITKQPKRARG